MPLESLVLTAVLFVNLLSGVCGREPEVVTTLGLSQISDRHWTPCASFDCSVATVFDKAPVAELRRRKQLPDTRFVDDFFELHGHNISVLGQVYYDVPKIIHQIWIGVKEPPTAWIDTWRWALAY